MRVFLYLQRLAPHFGPGQQAALLARELKRRGHDVVTFVEYEVAPDNDYVAAFRAAGVPVFAPGRLASRIECWARANEILLALLLPLRLMLTLADMALRRRAFARSWRGTRGRLNRYLPAVQLLRPLRWTLHRRMSREHSRSAADLVHTFSGTGSVFTWSARHHVPLVYNENSIPSNRFGVDWWSDVRHCADDVTLALSVCGAAVPHMRSYLSYEGPVMVIPCMLVDPLLGQDTQAGRSLPQPRRPSRTVVLGTAARLSVEKGHALLLRAAAIAECRCPGQSLEFWLAGDGPERETLRRLADDLGVSANVRFWGDCGPDKMATFWHGLDIFVLPSLLEGLPNCVLEAMAYGKAVIATDVGGVKEAVLDGQTGILVPPGDAQALAEAIACLATDPEAQTAMGRAGRERYQNRYQPDAVVEQYLAAYKLAVAPRVGEHRMAAPTARKRLVHWGVLR